jgi:hypothetical protein
LSIPRKKRLPLISSAPSSETFWLNLAINI